MAELLPVLLVIQVIIAVAMVTVILLQRSSSDGLAGLSGGGSSGGNSLISGRASANLLTKTTAFLAIGFMANSMAMATIAARSSSEAEKVIESITNEEALTDTDIEAEETGEVKEIEPTVPVSE